MSETDFQSWIKNKLPFFELMSAQVSFVLENLLKQNGINYLSVDSRTKTLEGINEKIKRKSYSNPRDNLTDIAGVRVILYLEEDVEKVCSIIKGTFTVDEKNSVSDLTRLATDKIGYRSTHFVCDIGMNRIEIPEYKSFAGLKFEVQVRTILQHAWANLTHDRVYKIGTKLPEHIKRKVNLYSGMLEIVDLGFSEIVKDVEKYRVEITRDDVADIELQSINSLNLIEFMIRYCKEHNYKHMDKVTFENIGEVIDQVIDELKLYNILTLKGVKDILPKGYIKKLNDLDIITTIIGMLRDAMMINDYNILYDSGVNWTFAGSNEEIDKFKSLMETYLGKDKSRDLFTKFEVVETYDF
ncbi:GTP pyrophosphokinase family protein [Serratia sp. OS31]|uniref:GTP pyrophosphokinase n=1 Tax=Serratia sp. OS31 TaxID=2760844 RepID=UPI0015FF1A2C|nr:GTP pyrophosphokinase [Serratia sp. OS31]MBB1583966.1 GTP pyrophosphokinase [Serratia sp. OS31]